MAESTLTLTYLDLMKAVADYLGLDPDIDTWQTSPRVLKLLQAGAGGTMSGIVDDGAGGDAEHGFVEGDYVTIAGSTTANVNGTYRYAHELASDPTGFNLSYTTRPSGSYTGTITAARVAKTKDWETKIDGYIQAGYRKFLYPINSDGTTFNWTFLRGFTSVATVAGQPYIALPDDYGGLVGLPSYEISTEAEHGKIKVVDEVTYDYLAQRNAATRGKPKLVNIYPKPDSDLNSGQRWRMRFLPIPDDEYNIWFHYRRQPPKLSRTALYHLGGTVHSETVLAAVLSEAERRENDMEGLHYQTFIRQLTASMQMDRGDARGRHFGYNGDASSSYGKSAMVRHRGLVTYEGTLYEPE